MTLPYITCLKKFHVFADFCQCSKAHSWEQSVTSSTGLTLMPECWSRLTTCKNADVVLTFFLHHGIYLYECTCKPQHQCGIMGVFNSKVNSVKVRVYLFPPHAVCVSNNLYTSSATCTFRLSSTPPISDSPHRWHRKSTLLKNCEA
jgi:hypothetical protein